MILQVPLAQIFAVDTVDGFSKSGEPADTPSESGRPLPDRIGLRVPIPSEKNRNV